MSSASTSVSAGFVPYPDLRLRLDGAVATLEMCRPPHNYFDEAMMDGMVEALRHLDDDDRCRAVVLASNGKSFCAGADFSIPGMSQPGIGTRLYARALKIFQTRKPIIAAVHGSAMGGGMGLSLTADFRVVAPSTRMAANFCRLGIHPGFGVSHTLPRLVGAQRAAMLLYTGRRVGGEEAVAIGLADVLAEEGQVLTRAQELAADIALSAPLALLSTRATLRRQLVDAIGAAMDHEAAQQDSHWLTHDFKEGVAAMAERRSPEFQGR